MSSTSSTFLIVFLVAGVFIAVTTGVGFLAPNSRHASRLTGSELRLELPKDFAKPISFATGRDGEKDLFYVDTKGSFRVKTYTDFGILESETVFVTSEVK
tara:strand:- start:1471 stop:1770 length:300 start_codon:yes stop_codon:yes gene_type:complete